MHAIYSFLMELPIRAGSKELKDSATSQFETQYVPLCDDRTPATIVKKPSV
jgi:hypothetical protein